MSMSMKTQQAYGGVFHGHGHGGCECAAYRGLEVGVGDLKLASAWSRRSTMVHSATVHWP